MVTDNTGWHPDVPLFDKYAKVEDKKEATVASLKNKIRTDLLTEANEIINKDRAATHGEAEDSFQTIANYWSVYLSKVYGGGIILTCADVAMLMVLFKTARIHNNQSHRDNWVDLIGYAALGGEIALTR